MMSRTQRRRMVGFVVPGRASTCCWVVYTRNALTKHIRKDDKKYHLYMCVRTKSAKLAHAGVCI